MIIEMLVWGFFSAWGWIGANAIKEKVWPEPPLICVVEQKEKKDDSEHNSICKPKQ